MGKIENGDYDLTNEGCGIKVGSALLQDRKLRNERVVRATGGGRQNCKC